jgi:hypothetical protein
MAYYPLHENLQISKTLIDFKCYLMTSRLITWSSATTIAPLNLLCSVVVMTYEFKVWLMDED